MGIFNGRAQGLIKSKGQLLKEATIKIGELEREREWLKNRLAYLVVAVNALGQHAKLEPLDAKKVIDDFIKEKEGEIAKQAEIAKEKYIEDIKKGTAKPIQFPGAPGQENG